MKRTINVSIKGEPRVKPASIRRCIPSIWTLPAILVTTFGVLFAAVPLLTLFASYDDEGYILVSVAHYLKEGHLYTKTFSQYGPFYFYAQSLFFQLLHLPVNHNMGRLVTLIYWLASSILAGVFVFRSSKSTFLGYAAGHSTMLAGRVLVHEPGHPQQVVLLLYMIAACLSLPLSPERKHLRMFFLGCVGAALLFTKLNVGVFYVAGLAHALVCLLPSGRLRFIGLGLTLGYAAIVPWLLMHASFDHGFRGYWLLATISGFATFAYGALVPHRDKLSARDAFHSVTGLLAGTALMIGGTWLQGMSMASLITGIILNPLHQPNLFYIPLDISLSSWLAVILIILIWLGLRLSGRSFAQARWLDAFQCIAGIVSLLSLSLGYKIQFVVPLLPLVLIRQSNWEHDPAALFSRMFITYMAATQFLEAYPVAGSQLGIAAVPMILWAFLCISDGVAGLRCSKSSRTPCDGLRLDAAIGGMILVVLASASLLLAARVLARSAGASKSWPLHRLPPASTSLPGSDWLHLPPEQATPLGFIARDVSANCHTLFTMPGMGSFNIWSGVPTPNGWNLTAWMKGIGIEHQAEILNIMKADSQSCAILNPGVLQLWHLNDASVAALPLAHYVMTEMPKVAEIDGYEIRVHPRRPSQWRQVP